MAWIYNKTIGATQAAILYNLKELLKSASWTVMSSGTGTGGSYSASGDVITHGGTGAGGMMNDRAWFRIRNQDGREFTFQLLYATYPYYGRAKYCGDGVGFIGGSPAANTTPFSPSELLIAASGTDASPGNIEALRRTADFRCIIGADTQAPYGFYAVMFSPGGATLYTTVLFDPLIGGSDDDPCVIRWHNDTSGVCTYSQIESYAAGISGMRGGLARFGKSASGSGASVSGSSFGYAGRGVTEQGKDVEAQILWARGTSQSYPHGIKGYGTVMQWHMPRRSNGSTASLITSRDRIIFDDVSFPWDGTEPDV